MATPKQVALSASPHANTGGALRKGAAGLASGAKTASFTVAHPDFTGHGLCSSDPWVQGIASDAPFHPTAAGELAIALADQHQLPKN
jgi:hypothetical protein